MEKLIDAYTFFEKENPEFKKEMEAEDLLVDIACEFIKYRATKGMTQKELADKLQITQAMVSKLESGDYNPSVKMLFDIAQKLSWDFSIQFSSKTENLNYSFDKIVQEQNEEYYDKMGFAS